MIVVGITGASGSIMGIRLIEELLNSGEQVVGIVSEKAWLVIEHELSYIKKSDTPLKQLLAVREGVNDQTGFMEFKDNDFYAPIASGSSVFEAAVVIPCSMKTLSAVANGYADNLITRACDVTLKESKKCILVPRETPLSLVHIENMRKIALAGGLIVPPMPGFYTRPQTIDDVIDFVVGKVLNLLGRKHTLFQSWGGMS